LSRMSLICRSFFLFDMTDGDGLAVNGHAALGWFAAATWRDFWRASGSASRKVRIRAFSEAPLSLTGPVLVELAHPEVRSA
jgi:hypothetical protein